VKNFLIDLLHSILRALGDGEVKKLDPIPTPQKSMPKIDPETNKPVSEPDKIYKIGISPGHGGSDTGAISANGLAEADVARKISKKLLERFNYNKAFNAVIYDYGINEPKNYSGRVKQSNSRGDDYYIPVHLNNWTPKPSKNGWLVFVNPKDAEKNPYLFPLCKEILNSLQSAYKIGYADWDKDRDGYMEGIGRKVYEESTPKADTVYLELGFLSNKEWDAKMADSSVHDKIADSIVSAFEKFHKLEKFRK